MEKKLVYILNQYSKKSDQHYFHVINLLEQIASQGVRVALVIEKCEDLPAIHSDNIELLAIGSNINRYRRLFCLYNMLSQLYLKGYKKIFIRISNTGVLVAIFCSFFYRSIETYYWHSGTVFEFNRRVKSKMALFVENIRFWFIKTFVTHFVTGPEGMKEYYVEVAKVKRDKIIILYNDIDLERFSGRLLEDEQCVRVQRLAALGIPGNYKVILFVHRLSPVRETLYYIPYILEEFYKRVTEDHYVTYIIGGGSDKEKLEKQLSKSVYADRIILLGSRPNSVIQDYYRVADIFINPTMAEGFPRVLIEAQALGVPIVSTDAGGIMDIVSDMQKPYIVPKLDKSAFLNAMISLARDSKERKRLGINNQIYVRRFSTVNVAKMYVDRIFN